MIGVRDLGDHAQVLYSLTVDGTDGLDTPYPVIGNALHGTGEWVVDSQYLCGIVGLAQQGCPEAERGAGTEPGPTIGAAERAAYERAGNEALGATARCSARPGW